VLHELLPENTEISGLFALLLLHEARRPARVNEQGNLLTLAQQNRSLWSQDYIQRGKKLLISALECGQVGTFQIQAAISAVHAEAKSFAATDWEEIALLYSKLYEFQPTPVVMLNAAVALSFAQTAQAGLIAIQELEQQGELDDYQPFHAARADMLKRAGHIDLAREAYGRAIALTRNEPERRFLLSCLSALDEPA
jgi:RNA polymerase sigma-70 factor (ECF subfamily)